MGWRVGGEQEQKTLELDFGHVKFEVSRRPHGTVEQGFGVQRRGVEVNFGVILCLDREGLREVGVPRERVSRRRRRWRRRTKG